MAKKAKGAYAQKQQGLEERKRKNLLLGFGSVFFLPAVASRKKTRPKASKTREKTFKGISKTTRPQKTRRGYSAAAM